MKRRQILCVAAAVLVFLLAIGLTLYPIISTHINASYASEIRTSYEAVIAEADNSDLLAAREAATHYNESITPGATDTDTYSQEALLAASQNYKELLNITGDGIMGYVEIPKIGVQLPIYHGTGADSLGCKATYRHRYSVYCCQPTSSTDH